MVKRVRRKIATIVTIAVMGWWGVLVALSPSMGLYAHIVRGLSTLKQTSEQGLWDGALAYAQETAPTNQASDLSPQRAQSGEESQASEESGSEVGADAKQDDAKVEKPGLEAAPVNPEDYDAVKTSIQWSYSPDDEFTIIAPGVVHPNDTIGYTIVGVAQGNPLVEGIKKPVDVAVLGLFINVKRQNPGDFTRAIDSNNQEFAVLENQQEECQEFDRCLIMQYLTLEIRLDQVDALKTSGLDLKINTSDGTETLAINIPANYIRAFADWINAK